MCRCAARPAVMCPGGELSWADIVGRPHGGGSRTASRAGTECDWRRRLLGQVGNRGYRFQSPTRGHREASIFGTVCESYGQLVGTGGEGCQTGREEYRHGREIP